MKKPSAFISTILCATLSASAVAIISETASARNRPDSQSDISSDSATDITSAIADQNAAVSTKAAIKTSKSSATESIESVSADPVAKAKTLSEADALALWHSSTASAIKGDLNHAVDGFQALLDSNQKTIGQDLILITVARLFYDHGQFEKSIGYFNQVNRQSDFWLDSIQERSWAFIRLNKLDEAQSSLTTLMVPSLAPQVSPEAFFEKSYLSLKRCDFATVFKTIDKFTDELQPRSHRMSQIVAAPHDAITEAFLNRLSNGTVSMVSLGKSAHDIPRLAQRDQQLLKFAKSKNMSAAYKRLGELAERDLVEIHTILRKMLVVQTETIEYMNLQESDKGANLHHASLEKNQIRFPYKESDKEVWLDELDHYHAQSAGCAMKKGG